MAFCHVAETKKGILRQKSHKAGVHVPFPDPRALTLVCCVVLGTSSRGLPPA